MRLWWLATASPLVAARPAAGRSAPAGSTVSASRWRQVRLGADGSQLAAADQPRPARRLRGVAPRRVAALGGRARRAPPVRCRGGERRRRHHRPAPDPARRPAGRPGDRPQPRTARARRPAAVAARCRGAIRALPPFTSRKHLPEPARPAARSSTGARRSGCAGRAPSSTRCASTSSATTSAASTGAPPPAATTSWSAPGSPSATAALLLVLDTSRTSAGRVGDVPRLDAAMDAALLLAALASRAGDRVDLLAGDRRVRAARRRREPRPTLLGDLVSARWRRWSPRWSRRTGRRWRRGRCTAPAAARWSCCSPPLEPAAVEECLLPDARRADPAPPGRARLGRRPARWRRWPPAAAHRGTSTTPRRRSARVALRERTAAVLRRAGRARHRREPGRPARRARRPLPAAEEPRAALTREAGRRSAAQRRPVRVSPASAGVDVTGRATPDGPAAGGEHVGEERRLGRRPRSPIRAHVGSGDGVTKASMTPRHEQHGRQPERDGHRGAALVRDGLRAACAARARPTPRTAAARRRRRRTPRSARASRAAGSGRRTARRGRGRP